RRAELFALGRFEIRSAEIEREATRLPALASVERFRVRIAEHDLRVEAKPARRFVRAVNAIAVSLTRTDAGQVAVPDESRSLRERNPRLAIVGIEETQLHAARVLRVEGEV